MSVHIYKYGLKWLYGRNVSSAINVRFRAYYAHFPGIDSGVSQTLPPRGEHALMAWSNKVILGE